MVPRPFIVEVCGGRYEGDVEVGGCSRRELLDELAAVLRVVGETRRRWR
jgi:hypothetical protein